MKRASGALPVSLPPVGINREQAAAFVGISSSLFDRLVYAGKMPEPREVGGRLVWDVDELTSAFRALPHRSEAVDAGAGASNPWD